MQPGEALIFAGLLWQALTDWVPTVTIDTALAVAGLAVAIASGALGFVIKVSSRLASIETKVDFFWRLLGEKAAIVLHSPHTPLLDTLLEQYAANTLTPDEVDTLLAKLNIAEQDTREQPGYRLAAAMLSLAIRQGRNAVAVLVGK